MRDYSGEQAVVEFGAQCRRVGVFTVGRTVPLFFLAAVLHNKSKITVRNPSIIAHHYHYVSVH